MCSAQLQQGCCWVWTNPPGGQTHPSLTYEQVLAATAGCPPQAVTLVAVPPSSHPAAAAAPSGPRVSLVALQQQRAQADRLAAAVGGGLPDSSFYLRQLPYFDDTTPCWQLWGSSSQVWLSINHLRARLQSQEVPLHQLVSHIWDGQGRPAWVYELCMLRMLDKAYEDRSAQVETQQQQQQHAQLAHLPQQQQAAAAVALHTAAAGRPLVQHTVPALHQQQQQQPIVSPVGMSWQAPPGQQQQQQPMWHQQQGSSLQQQQQVVQDARAPLPSSHPQQLQQHLWSPPQWRQQQHQQSPSLMQQQQQQQQQPFGVLQHQRAAVGVHSTPGAPSPPAPATPPAATQEAGSPAGPAIPAVAAAAVDAAVALAGVSSSSRPAAAAGAAAPPLPPPPQQQQQVVGAGGTNQQQQQPAVHGDQAGVVCAQLQVRARAILRRVLLSPALLQEIRATFFQPKTDPATVSLPCGPECSASQAAAAAPGGDAASAAGASSSSSRGPLPPHSRPAAADPAGWAGQVTAAAAAAAGSAAGETAVGGVPPVVRRGGSLQQQAQPPPSEEEEEADMVGVQQQGFSSVQVMAVLSQQDSRTAPRVPAAAAAATAGPQPTQLLLEGLVSKGTAVLDTHVPPAAQHESSPEAKKPEDVAAGAAAVERLQLDSPLASSALQADRLLGRPQQQQQQEQQSERQPSITPAKRRKVLSGHEEGGLAAAADVVRSAVQVLDPDTRAAVLEATGARPAHHSSRKVQQGAERPQQQLARLSQPQQQQQQQGGGAQQVAWHKRRRSTDTAGSSADVDEATQQEIRSAALGLRARSSSQQQRQSQEQQASKLNAPAMLAAAFPSPAARSRTRRPRARSASAPAAGRAAPVEPSPPVLNGCARGLPLTEARAAAAACKKPGYCHGLHQVLMRRERLKDHRTAAAAAGVTTGPYGSRAQLVPYALPASLLHRDKPAAAASSGRGEGGLTAPASRTGSSTSRSQRALRGEPLARNMQLLAEAKRRQAARPPGKALALQRSGVHGYGLFAAERITAGEFVIEYVGEIIRPVLEDLVEARYEAAGQCSSYLFT